MTFCISRVLAPIPLARGVERPWFIGSGVLIKYWGSKFLQIFAIPKKITIKNSNKKIAFSPLKKAFFVFFFWVHQKITKNKTISRKIPVAGQLCHWCRFLEVHNLCGRYRKSVTIFVLCWGLGDNGMYSIFLEIKTKSKN